MKKNLIYFLALLFLGFMTSCTDDKDPAASKPTIAFTGIPEGETTQGEFAAPIKALVDAPEKIEKFEVKVPFPTPAGVIEVTTDLAADPASQPAIGGVNYHTAIHLALGVNYKDVKGETNYTLTISADILNQLIAGTYSIPVTVTDKEEMSTTATAELTIAPTVTPAVTVTFKVGEDDVTDSVTVNHGTVLTIVPTSNVGAAIKSVTVNGTAVEAVDNAYSYTLAASGAYTVVATDVNDVASTETIIKAGINLTAAADYTLNLDGGDKEGTNEFLNQYGLEYINNGDGTNAIIGSTNTSKLVKLPTDAWETLTTQGALSVAIETATALDRYEGISASEDKTYDNEYLGTKVEMGSGDEAFTVYYLIKVGASDVQTGNGTGGATLIVVTGQAKSDYYTAE